MTSSTLTFVCGLSPGFILIIVRMISGVNFGKTSCTSLEHACALIILFPAPTTGSEAPGCVCFACCRSTTGGGEASLMRDYSSRSKDPDWVYQHRSRRSSASLYQTSIVTLESASQRAAPEPFVSVRQAWVLKVFDSRFSCDGSGRITARAWHLSPVISRRLHSLCRVDICHYGRRSKLFRSKESQQLKLPL